MPDTEWTTEDVREEFAHSMMLHPYYDGGSDDIVQGREDFDAWLAAHDAEVAAKALEAMGEFFRMASQLGTGERDEITAQACFDRAAALRGGDLR